MDFDEKEKAIIHYSKEYAKRIGGSDRIKFNKYITLFDIATKVIIITLLILFRQHWITFFILLGLYCYLLIRRRMEYTKTNGLYEIIAKLAQEHTKQMN